MGTDLTALHQALRAEQERRKRALDMKVKAEEDFLAFVRMMWPVIEPATPFVEGWAVEAICDFLMAASDGHIKRGIINVPPGFSKSTLLNVMFPAWEMGPCNMPHLRYLSASYSTTIPERDNVKFARVVKHPIYRAAWGERFDILRDGIELVENNKTGWKKTTSIGSGTTGQRGDRFLLDDANDPMSVESDRVREETNRFLREVMPDRINSLTESVIINLQQRTHNEDATGTLAKYGTGYTDHWLMIPMEFDPLRIFPVVLRWDEDGEPADTWVDPRSLDENGNQLAGLYTNEKGNAAVHMGSPMAQAEGELAWPERFPAEAVDEMRKIKENAYDAQYQQSPNPKKGNIIRRDWWQTWTQKHFPAIGTVIASLDTAIEENDDNDFNALTVWGAFEGATGAPQLILMDAWWDKLPLAQLVARVAELCFKHKVDYLLIEHKTRGRDTHDEIIRGYQNASWQTHLVKVDGSKRSRLEAVSRLFSGEVRRLPEPGSPGKFIDTWAGGMIWAPNTSWAEETIDQCAEFPKAAHDDLADSTSQALLWVRRNGIVIRKVEHETQVNEKLKFRKSPGVPYAIGRK